MVKGKLRLSVPCFRADSPENASDEAALQGETIFENPKPDALPCDALRPLCSSFLQVETKPNIAPPTLWAAIIYKQVLTAQEFSNHALTAPLILKDLRQQKSSKSF